MAVDPSQAHVRDHRFDDVSVLAMLLVAEGEHHALEPTSRSDVAPAVLTSSVEDRVEITAGVADDQDNLDLREVAVDPSQAHVRDHRFDDERDIVGVAAKHRARNPDHRAAAARGLTTGPQARIETAPRAVVQEFLVKVRPGQQVRRMRPECLLKSAGERLAEAVELGRGVEPAGDAAEPGVAVHIVRLRLVEHSRTGVEDLAEPARAAAADAGD